MIYKILAREPVSLGKAIMATVTLLTMATSWSELIKGAVITAALGWVGWAERMLSTPTRTVEAKEQAAYDKAIADVSSLQPPPTAAPPLPAPVQD